MLKTKTLIALTIGLSSFAAAVTTTVPNAPTNLSATKLDDTNTSIRFSFKDNATNENGFTLSINDYTTSSHFATINIEADSGSNEFIYKNVSGLICQDTYQATVVAYNAEDNSTVSNTTTFNMESTFNATCPEPLNAPGPYIGVTAIDENSTAAHINFADNSDNEDGFRLFDTTGDINVTIPENNGTQVSYNLSNLTCDKVYSVQAVAFKNGMDDSAPSDLRSFRIESTLGIPCELSALNAPGPYIGVTAIDENSTAAHINFADNSDNEDGFRLFDTTGEINVTIPANNGTQVSYNLTNLTCDKVYSVQAVALKNGMDASAPSDLRSFRIESTLGIPCDLPPMPEPTPLNAPGPYIGVTAIDGNNSAALINFADNSDNEDGFRLFDTTGEINVTIPANDETQNPQVVQTLSNLTCNRVYSLQVVALNNGIESAPSDVRDFRIETTLGIPCN